jgi:hypothetical protein
MPAHRVGSGSVQPGLAKDVNGIDAKAQDEAQDEPNPQVLGGSEPRQNDRCAQQAGNNHLPSLKI